MMITVLSVIMPLRAFNTTNVVGVLRGGGDVRVATLVDLSPLWLVSIPFAAVMGLVLKWGIFWVYMGLSAEQIVKFFLGVYRLRSRRWINDITQARGSGEKAGGRISTGDRRQAGKIITVIKIIKE